ncbi:hypothetical protein HLRTI_000779 [Halorhabdus tiamatea SARL4B]|uniref:DUF447 family protein n=1 Tax=Halorhabdus tiamatea SARL4B TaxID=1033806 RepID=F7PP31_9EURY|nr:DUF447 domain-containing protein [Halorhabdus tiamatea]ERJ07180.1 hypothetical protein HLRTI_000779 [Halorhabdus tiamatea SARL4B]CCQ32801.1 conserved hypothetical protein (DUF447) [Halorhabdus tiamatea SARL4B]
MSDPWPVELRGITESVVTTLGPDGSYNVAALGLSAGDPVTATTWGQTRTRRNFEREGEGYVQFTRDPVDFVEAALTVWEADEPILPTADAWAKVAVEHREADTEDGTEWVEWTLEPIESAVERETVPTTNRGYAAVIEATVAASRLDVPAYDDDRLAARLAYFAAVIERCGGEREQVAWERLETTVDLPAVARQFESF